MMEIQNKSKQSNNQIYCSTKCRKTAHRKKKSKVTRIEQRRANLRQNDEILYLVNQCRRAKTVQILKDHDLKSFVATMDLVRNRPNGDVKLCHISPVKGNNSTGLFHHHNLFYGGSHQNRKFGRGYFSGGLSISNEKLIKKWSVTDEMSTNDILLKIENFLGDVITEYIKVSPVRKSKKVQIIEKITGIDQSRDYDTLIPLSYKDLLNEWSRISNTIPFNLTHSRESKFLAYIDELTRFISYGGERVSLLKKLRGLMIIGYMALERVSRSETYNKYFYVKYEPLIKAKYAQAMLKNSDDWSEFKDLIYNAAFEVLQGKQLNIVKFRKKAMSYLKFPDKAWLDTKIPYEYSYGY